MGTPAHNVPSRSSRQERPAKNAGPAAGPTAGPSAAYGGLPGLKAALPLTARIDVTLLGPRIEALVIDCTGAVGRAGG